MDSDTRPDRTDIPIYSPYKDVPVNGSILLYEGVLYLTTLHSQTTTNGKIEFILGGKPHIRFTADLDSTINFLATEGTLAVPPVSSCTPAQFMRTVSEISSLDSVGSLRGVLEGEGLVQKELKMDGKPEAVGRIKFHLINFRKYRGAILQAAESDRVFSWSGRISFPFGQWLVTLDQFRNVDEKFEEANASNGFAFTHVGVLQRSDNKLFNPDDAQSVVEALYWFLSFINGARTAYALLTGLRHTARPLWQQWIVHRASTVHDGDNWFSENATQQCFSAGDRFFQHWSNPDKRDWLKAAVAQYLASNRFYSGIELTLALSQITLEMLTWIALLEENSLMSSESFEKLPAADRIRSLLFWLGVQTSIPSKLTNLKSAYKNFDAPYAVSDIRNAVIHPTKANRVRRSRISNNAIYEAWQLNQWYSELTLLKLIGYSGAYNNRIGNPSSRLWDMLPWTP